MAAVSISLAFSIDPLKPSQYPKFGLSSSSSSPRYPLQYSCRFHGSNLRFAFPPSHSFSVSTATETGEETAKSTGSYAFLEESFLTGKFFSNEEFEKLKSLEGFAYFQELESGSMWVRVMRPEEMDSTVKLLAESFGESMLLPAGYQSVLRFLVKQYLIERRKVLPHAVTLVGSTQKTDAFSNGEEAEMTGTVEVCFDKRGANASPPSPTSPKESPYVCNMTVKEDLRRMIDEAPFSMYRKAGYEVVKTDTILVLLMLQRRKHLMCKKLPLCTRPSDSVDMVGSDIELTSSANV